MRVPLGVEAEEQSRSSAEQSFASQLPEPLRQRVGSRNNVDKHAETESRMSDDVHHEPQTSVRPPDAAVDEQDRVDLKRPASLAHPPGMSDGAVCSRRGYAELAMFTTL